MGAHPATLTPLAARSGRVASALDVSESIHDRACSLFRSAQNEDLLRGRSIEAMTVASVYAACGCNRLPLTIAEVCEVSRVSREHVENAYHVLNQELGLPAVPPTPPTVRPVSGIGARVLRRDASPC